MNLGALILTLVVAVIPLFSPSPEPEKAWLRWINATPGNGPEEKAESENQKGDTKSLASPSAEEQHQATTGSKTDKSSAPPSSIWQKAFAPETWSQWALLAIGIIAGILVPLWLIIRQARTSPERARIAVDGFKFIVSKDGKTFKYSFVMINTGPTPAHIFEMNYSWLRMPDEDNEFISKMGGNVYGGPIVKEELTIQAHQKIVSTTNDWMPFLPEEMPILYALGYIRYRDVLGSEYKTALLSNIAARTWHRDL